MFLRFFCKLFGADFSISQLCQCYFSIWCFLPATFVVMVELAGKINRVKIPKRRRVAGLKDCDNCVAISLNIDGKFASCCISMH